MSQARESANPMNGRKVLLMLVAFFGVIFCVNGVFAYFAVSTFNGLVTEGSYRKGLQYDKQLAAEAAQQRLGWTTALDLSADGRKLRFSVMDSNGRPVSGRQVRVELGRPATDRFDRRVVLRESGPGTYASDVALPGAGNWIAQLAVIEGDGDSEEIVYRMKKRLWLRPQG